MSEPKIDLVEPKTFTINLPSIGSPVTVSAESDEVVITMRLTLRPRDNVMNLDLDISTSGNGAPMTCLNQDATADMSRYWRATLPG